MSFNQFIGTFFLGRVCSPIYSQEAIKLCKECEPFVEKGSNILDLGCGRGILSDTFKNYFQAQVTGVDVSDQRVVDLPFKIIDGKRLPFPDNYFDAVLIIYVLHHAKYPEELLKETKRVVKNKIIVCEDLEDKGLTHIACWLHKNTYKLGAPAADNPIVFRNEKGWESLFKNIDLKINFKKKLRTKLEWLYPAKHILYILEK